MSLFDSLIEFIGSGLVVAASDSLVIEAQNGHLRLSAYGGSGVLDYNQGAGYWQLRNNADVQPIMSGINGVPGPEIKLTAGSGVNITANAPGKEITISAESANVVGYSQSISGYRGSQTFTHNLGTTFIVPSFKAVSGPAGVPDVVFQPRRVRIINANQIRVRMAQPIDFEMTLIGYKP